MPPISELDVCSVVNCSLGCSQIALLQRKGAANQKRLRNPALKLHYRLNDTETRKYQSRVPLKVVANTRQDEREDNLLLRDLSYFTFAFEVPSLHLCTLRLD